MCAARIQTQNNDRQDYGLFFSDGLLDIFTGLGLLGAGALMFTDLIFLMGVYPAIMLPAWQVGRKKTLDRLSARLGGQVLGAYEARIRAVLLGVMLAGVLMLALGLGAFLGFDRIPLGVFDWLNNYHLAILGMVMAAVASACGIVLGTRRFHLYAALTLALFVGGHFIGISLPVILLVLGAFVSGIGIVILTGFMGDYPAA